MYCMKSNLKNLFLVFILSIFISSVSYAQCVSISNELNTINPSFVHNFNVSPSLSFSNTPSQSINLRLRSTGNNWRLLAYRSGPNAISSTGGPSGNNLSASDISYNATLSGVMVTAGRATLTPPFTSLTDLSSINTSNTEIMRGTQRTSANCAQVTSGMTTQYWQLTTAHTIPQDFFFNVGSYQTIINYTLVSP